MISASTQDLQSASEMTHNSPSKTHLPLSPLLLPAPPSVCGQVSILQQLDMGHLTDNSIRHEAAVTMCVGITYGC